MIAAFALALALALGSGTGTGTSGGGFVTFGQDSLRGEPGPGVHAVALSPSGDAVAWVGGGEIVVASTADGRTLHRLRAPVACTDLAIDDGGARVACEAGHFKAGERVQDADEPAPRATPSDGTGWPSPWLARTLDGKLRIKRDGKRVLLLGRGTPIVLEPALPGEERNYPVRATLSRDGSAAAVAWGDGADLFRTSDGKLVAHVGAGLRLFHVEFSSDGRVALFRAPAALVFVDAHTGKELRSLAVSKDETPGWPVLSGDGAFAAEAGSFSDVQLVARDAPERAGRGVRIPIRARRFALSRDATVVAVAADDAAIRVFRASPEARGGYAEVLFDRLPGPADAALSADGARLAVVAEDGVRVYDARTGRLLDRWAQPLRPAPAAFSSDGRRLFLLARATLTTIDLVDHSATETRVEGTRAALADAGAAWVVGYDGGLSRWDLETGARTAPRALLSQPDHMVATRDHAWLSASGAGRAPHVRRATPERVDEVPLAVLAELPRAAVLAVHEASGRVIVGEEHGTALVVHTGTQRTAELPERGTARFTADGRVVVVPYHHARELTLFDPASGATVRVPIPAQSRLMWVQGDKALLRRGGQLTLLQLPREE